MIPALIALFLLLSGGDSAPFADLVKQFQSASKDVVIEKEHREAMRDVFKEMASAIKAHEKSRDRSIKDLLELGKDHGASEADYRAIFDAQSALDATYQEKMIALYGELKSHVTADEWAAIVAKSNLPPTGS